MHISRDLTWQTAEVATSSLQPRIRFMSAAELTWCWDIFFYFWLELVKDWHFSKSAWKLDTILSFCYLSVMMTGVILQVPSAMFELSGALPRLTVRKSCFMMDLIFNCLKPKHHKKCTDIKLAMHVKRAVCFPTTYTNNAFNCWCSCCVMLPPTPSITPITV